MVEKRPWEEFQAAGLLWWINRGLHLFGWAIVFMQNPDGTIGDVYPARCSFRGFTEADEEEGFQRVTAYLAHEITDLQQECVSEEPA